MTPRQFFLLGRKVDVNRDPWERITELPGLSDRVARAVVARRSREGPYRRPEDLLAVRGIKEKRLQKILPFLAPLPNN